MEDVNKRLRDGFNLLREDEQPTVRKTRNRPINYGHADEDYNEALSEQSYYALNAENGKWEKRTIRRRTS